MRRVHDMPFGAQAGAGETRFRLWAPACATVQLELGGEAPLVLPMNALADGWHELSVKDVGAGDAYRFRIGATAVPDPASRSNPRDVNGPSAVVDPRTHEWTDAAWRGRPWREAVVYELHIGTFTPEGTFASAIGKLEYLARLGVTALEIMPVADFAGRRGWGYDGVLPFAPDAAYGAPDDFKRFVQAAHAHRLMVLLDVVYNHFGPEGNYLSSYAPQFFNAAHQTPWGAAINFDGRHARTVRDFFVHNALYWVEEFHLDGLRMDAIHAIADDSPTHIVHEIAAAIAAGPGRGRPVHVVLENERNEARHIEGAATAQWNDAAHHCLHVLLTGETDGYYAHFKDRPAERLGELLAAGFASHLPLGAFVNFLQNHDQVGNRAMGERLAQLATPEALRLAAAVVLLAPSPPLIFMGEEFGARTPFLYFCDFEGELARAVREGRRREFKAFARFADEKVREAVPDPGAEKTFLDSKLPWEALTRPEHAAWLEHHRKLLALRHSELMPRLEGTPSGRHFTAGETGLGVDWVLGDGSRLHLRANLGASPVRIEAAPGERLHVEGTSSADGRLAAWSGHWTLEAA